MKVIKDRDDFNVATKKDYVLIDCTAKWCAPCQRIKPKIHDLSKDEKYNEVDFYIYDIDDDDELSEEFIKVVPTFLLFKDGEMYKMIEGADYKRVVRTLDEMIEESDDETNDSS